MFYNIFSYLAKGERFQYLHFKRFQRRLDATTIRLIVNEVCIVIWKLLLAIYLPTPKEKGWIKISKDFNKVWNFPNCTGAIIAIIIIDGKHIIIQCPLCADSEYFNNKRVSLNCSLSCGLCLCKMYNNRSWGLRPIQ
jgi:hypothetical protein|uniref:DDE Tnp4 domain-containing protein n=1 Tax=Sipha flava TaxID=143950 RepID=A0A2S2Q4G4_9HEMI